MEPPRVVHLARRVPGEHRGRLGLDPCGNQHPDPEVNTRRWRGASKFDFH